MNLACKLLHVEDCDDDSFMFQRVLERLLFAGVYRRVNTIDGAMNYLSGKYEFGDRRLFPLPDVIILDTALGGTKRTGELMTWMNEQPEFSGLVKVVLTGGASPRSQRGWLAQGVAVVSEKGVSLDDLARSVEDILRRCDSSDD